ncbi:hypothetical protein FM21_19080 [Streptomyces mutabilis]|uniref:Uncharacterized protein n=1 Tax=Streptomyces mutabilis TaxID=67332 RepID=A0A086MVN3_9ACTN|nr:hypothetical protein FM21_19080 [Streptomyces mutabilis]
MNGDERDTTSPAFPKGRWVLPAALVEDLYPEPRGPGRRTRRTARDWFVDFACFGRGRRLVAGHRPGGVQSAEPPRPHRLARARVAGVEAPLEAHLQDRSGGLHLGDRLQRARHVQRDGLLAEHRQSRARGTADQLGVGRRRRGDHDGVDAPPEDLVHPGRRRLA